MTGILVRAAGLAGIYLLVLTSAAPGDVLTGGLVALGVVLVVRPRRGAHRGDATGAARLAAAAGVLRETIFEMVRGTWWTARFCLGARCDPGFVELPREDRSRIEVALWGVLTGEAPDEIVVDVAGDVLTVHLVDARDPGAVRERHRRAREGQRKVAS